MTILEQHPKVTALIKQWLLKDMNNSLNRDQKEIPADLKPALEELASSNDRIMKIIEEHPRSLFDLFDENKVYIHVEPFLNELENDVQSFGWRILGQEYNNLDCNSRKTAEQEAIAEAFKILEEKL